jgi:hypothetical protein
MFSKSREAARKQRAKQPEKKRKKRREIHLLAGFAAGVIGGIVATWVVDMYQHGALAATRRAEDAVGAGPILSARQEDHLQERRRAHAETAERLVRSTTGKRLSRTQRRHAARVIHYAIGAIAGGIYGVAAEILPVVRRGYGTGYSNLLFLGGSNALLPWLPVGARQRFAPMGRDSGLSAPLVYGATLETTRRVLRFFL